MKRLIPKLTTLLALVGVWVGTAASAQASITWEFNNSFADGTPPAPAPWLVATLSQSGSGVVDVTISFPSAQPANLKLFWFGLNFAGDASTLSVSGLSSSIDVFQSQASWGNDVNAFPNVFKADGDGYYDLVLQNSGDGILTSPGTLSFQITGTDITPESFNTGSFGGAKGSFLAAAHIGGYASSIWVSGQPGGDTPQVPEPTTLLAGLLLLLPFGASAIRIIRKNRS